MPVPSNYRSPSVGNTQSVPRRSGPAASRLGDHQACRVARPTDTRPRARHREASRAARRGRGAPPSGGGVLPDSAGENLVGSCTAGKRCSPKSAGLYPVADVSRMPVMTPRMYTTSNRRSGASGAAGGEIRSPPWGDARWPTITATTHISAHLGPGVVMARKEVEGFPHERRCVIPMSRRPRG